MDENQGQLIHLWKKWTMFALGLRLKLKSYLDIWLNLTDFKAEPMYKHTAESRLNTAEHDASGAL